MRRLLIGLVAGVTLGASLAAAAASLATGPKPECHSNDADTRACLLQGAEEYLLRVPSLDLDCVAHVKATDDDRYPYLSCYRHSTYNRCVHGRSRSLTSVVTRTRMFFKAADRCVAVSNGLGFRVTKVGRNLAGYTRAP
ncbi:MAG: hypothetical protein ACTHKS_03015 [Gaiellaceae bacterium]